MAPGDDSSRKKRQAEANESGDFDAEKIAPTMKQHDADIAEIFERVKAIEGTLKPEGMLSLLKNMFDKDKAFDAFLSGVFAHLMKEDKNAREAIRSFVQEEDRSLVTRIYKVIFSKVGWMISIAASTLIGVAMGHLWK